MIVPPAFDWYLLAGDETALPAIGRRIEELPAGAKVLAIIEVDSPAEEQSFKTATDLSVTYVHRNGRPAGTTDLLLSAVSALDFPPGDGHAFVACESGMSKALRQHLVEQRGFNPEWVRAAGYWLFGIADAHDPH
jgi:NADPH-dependent ferric siderophore reductase